MASKEFSNLLVGGNRKSRSESNGNGISEETVSKSASLLDDTLSDKKKKTNWKTPIWVAALLISASLLAVYFSGSDQADETRLTSQEEASRNPELLEKLVSEAKSEEENPATSGLQAEPLRQMNPSEPSVETTTLPSARETSTSQKTSAKAPPVSTKASDSPARTEPAGQTAADRPEATTAQQDSPSEELPQLIRDVRKEAPTEEESTSTAPAPPANPHQESFDYLESNNPVAGKLINGGYSNLNYSGWKVIRETNQEVWIDIEAAWSSGGAAVHHIWSVDITNERIKALSQAARNLEALNN